MKNILFLGLALIAATAVSCKKNKEEDKQTVAPAITISAPAALQTFNYGDTVKISGTISGSGMHGYNVRLINLSTGMNVLNQGYHEHGDAFTISEKWKNTVTDTTQLKIVVDVAIDHDGSVATQERIISCYPQ